MVVPRDPRFRPVSANSSDPLALLLAARVVRSKAQASKGYGFVKFQHVQQAVEAIHTFNGFILNNHPLEVKFADQDAGPPLSGNHCCTHVWSHQHHHGTQLLYQRLLRSTQPQNAAQWIQKSETFLQEAELLQVTTCT